MDKSKLNAKELVVYELIEAGTITQLQIAKSAKWLGCHEVHESHLHEKQASTLRQIRQIVRDLRINHGAKILSSRNGYFICHSNEEAIEYLNRMEVTAKAQAKAWMVTYNTMRQIFNVESEYFNKQMQLWN